MDSNLIATVMKVSEVWLCRYPIKLIYIIISLIEYILSFIGSWLFKNTFINSFASVIMYIATLHLG